jgi:hypothetical protein
MNQDEYLKMLKKRREDQESILSKKKGIVSKEESVEEMQSEEVIEEEYSGNPLRFDRFPEEEMTTKKMKMTMMKQNFILIEKKSAQPVLFLQQ